MPKQLPLIAGGIGVIIVVAVVAFLVMGNKASQTPSETPKAVESEADQTGANTIRGLLGLGKNVMCTFENTDETGNTSSGTVYVAGEQMRGDFNNSGPAGAFEGHMIRDGEYAYSWSSLVSQGTKFKLDQEESDDKSEKSVDLDKQVDMDCQSWSGDSSKFNLPEGIEFQDISKAVKQVEEQSEDAQQLQQSACEQITDSQAKAACMQAL